MFSKGASVQCTAGRGAVHVPTPLPSRGCRSGLNLNSVNFTPAQPGNILCGRLAAENPALFPYEPTEFLKVSLKGAHHPIDSPTTILMDFLQQMFKITGFKRSQVFLPSLAR